MEKMNALRHLARRHPSASSTSRLFSNQHRNFSFQRQTPTIVTRCKNGMRVATQRTSDPTVTVGVWIDAGSRYETKESNGVAHFLEHMTFKGTQRRSRLGLETEIENMGGRLNAYTSREQTVYYARVFAEDVRNGLDILSDILLSSNMDVKSITAERDTILREMEEVEKTTEEVIFDRLHLTCFRDNPLGNTILGPVENIQSIQKDQLKDYINRNYTADRMVVVAAGNVNHEEIEKYTEELFAQCKPTAGPSEADEWASVSEANRPKFCGAELRYCSEATGDPYELAHFAVAFEGASWTNPDVVSLMLLQQIIGSFRKEESQKLVPADFSSNPLVRNLMKNGDNNQLCESFASYNTCYKDTGLFGVYAMCPPAALESTAFDIMCGLSRLSFDIKEEELVRARRELKTSLFGVLDDSTSVAEDIGRMILVYGRRLSHQEVSMRLNAIQVEDLMAAARKYILGKDIALVAQGPIDNLPSYDEFRKLNSMKLSF